MNCGIKTAVVSKISKKYEIFELCEELFPLALWKSFISCNCSYNVNKQFEEKDFLIFEK